MPAPIAMDFDDEDLAGGVGVVDWTGAEAGVALGVCVDDAAREDVTARELATFEVGDILCDEILLTDAPATNTNWPKPPEKGVSLQQLSSPDEQQNVVANVPLIFGQG